jgi:hypothetical protein
MAKRYSRASCARVLASGTGHTLARSALASSRLGDILLALISPLTPRSGARVHFSTSEGSHPSFSLRSYTTRTVCAHESRFHSVYGCQLEFDAVWSRNTGGSVGGLARSQSARSETKEVWPCRPLQQALQKSGRCLICVPTCPRSGWTRRLGWYRWFSKRSVDVGLVITEQFDRLRAGGRRCQLSGRPQCHRHSGSNTATSTGKTDESSRLEFEMRGQESTTHENGRMGVGIPRSVRQRLRQAALNDQV